MSQIFAFEMRPCQYQGLVRIHDVPWGAYSADDHHSDQNNHRVLYRSVWVAVFSEGIHSHCDRVIFKKQSLTHESAQPEMKQWRQERSPRL
jgi:hypothetical protein